MVRAPFEAPAVEVLSAIIDGIDPTKLALRLNCPFTQGGSEDMEGTGGVTGGTDAWADFGHPAPDTVDLFPVDTGIWVPGGTGIITVVTDYDFGPYVLTLPLPFTIAP